MSVDKFGRHAVSSGKGERGPKGEGYNFTTDGDYDVQNKRLCNVLSAKEEVDAVNLGNVKSLISPCVKEVNGVFDFNNKTVTGIKDSENEQDAVNFKTLKRNSVHLTTDGHYDVQNKRVCNVLNAVADTDAVNLSNLKSLINPCVKEVNNVFDFKNKILTGIADAKHDLDAVNFKVLKRNASLALTTTGYNARNKKIINVKAPDGLSDVVIVKYLNDNCIVRNPKTDSFNGNGKRISNVADPKDGQDVVTNSVMIAIIMKLGWVIYNELNKDKPNKHTINDWYNIMKNDLTSLTTWQSAFNLVEIKDNQIVKDGPTGKT